VCSAVVLLSLLAAVDPVRIGITALLVSRPRPMLNLLAFWLGGMAAGIGAALAVLLFLRHFTTSVIRAVVSATSSPITAYLQVSIGVLAVSFATLLLARRWARQRLLMPVSGGGSPTLQLEPDTPRTSRRLSIRGRLEVGSCWMAFVAGVALATPPVEYMAAILAILASEPAAPAQFGAALMFTVVAFTVVEIPLITYLAAPAQTLAVVQGVNDWIGQRRQAIPGLVAAVSGVLLVATGMGRV